MKSILLTTAAIVGSLSQIAPAASQVDVLRNRCAEQARQIKSLEQEIDSMHALLAKNNLRPTKRSIAAATPSISGNSYTIRKGDNLSRVAKRNGISLKALLAVNKGIDPRRLKIGQKINLPGSTKKVSQTSTTPSKKPNLGVLPAPIKPSNDKVVAANSSHTEVTSTTTYTVRQKDTLYHIARKNNTSVANILELNAGLSPNKLRIGQSIRIAGSPAAKSTAKPASTKPTANPKAEAPAATPTVSNNQPKEEVAAKATPARVAETPKPAQTVTNTPAQPKVRTVAVTRQMTFGDFASTHGATVEQLNEMNNLRLSKSTVLAQGSELYIPNIQN